MSTAFGEQFGELIIISGYLILLLCLGLMALLLAVWAQVKKRFLSSSPDA